MPATIAVGDWIGNRFQVFDIHQGGMSLVYVVNDHLGEPGRRIIALKTLRGELLRSRIRVSRFAAECRIWAQLGEHPNIVRAYSVEIIDGRPFVSLELIQGGDLYRWIGSPKLDLPQALRFSYQFCRGMEHALRQGLHCHRDIKPGNLLVTEQGTLKITDFGLARACEEMVAVRPALPDGSIPLEEAAKPQRIIFTDPRDRPEVAKGMESLDTSAPAARSSQKAGGSSLSEYRMPAEEVESRDHGPAPGVDPSRLTRSGARLGTGPYMAPEQFRDPRSVDVRADIYSFGIVLYEMIAGKLPFKARSIDAWDDFHTVGRVGSVARFIPYRYSRLAGPVDLVIQRCLAKDPDDRYQSMADLRKAIKQVAAPFTKR